ncbi:FAD-dependent oxidoreductase [Mycobacterium yunnanensis]|uniref:FAD-dependent oxidoreductase n=1 Tax=Mycobacterium yunnanensis TaxID=368477 RepID=A0A9X3BWC1_9MYCO|nr:FAD-dependent oxidoreductase [Mycobacterium yunnanensis]MCV7424504.1 FAD-dependent oxidoreductase [Mycobacterium yunnanensis]
MFGVLNVHQLKFVESRDVGGAVRAFRFQPDTDLGWVAGQHGLLRLPGMKVKPFTIASAPEEECVVIGTSLLSASAYKRRLGALTVGDRVTFHGPLMNFTLGDDELDVVMLAQGVGITPFRAMLRARALGDAQASTTTLVHVASDHAFRSDTEADATAGLYPHHAAEFAEIVEALARKRPNAAYLIAGQRRFVTSAASLLADAGVGRGQIRRDTYLGYTPRGDST